MAKNDEKLKKPFVTERKYLVSIQTENAGDLPTESELAGAIVCLIPETRYGTVFVREVEANTETVRKNMKHYLSMN